MIISCSQIVNFYFPYSSEPTPEKLRQGIEFEKSVVDQFIKRGFTYQFKCTKPFFCHEIRGVIDLINFEKKKIIEIKNYPIIHEKCIARVRLQLSLYGFLVSNDEKEYESFRLYVLDPSLKLMRIPGFPYISVIDKIKHYIDIVCVFNELTAQRSLLFSST